MQKLNGYTWICLVALAFLQGIDIASTDFILRAGGMELNPLMIGIVQWPYFHILIKEVALGVLIVMVLQARSYHRHGGTVTALGALGFYCVVAVNNLICIFA